MALTIDQRLRLELERTSLRKLARTLQDPDDWQRAVRVMNGATQMRVLAKDRYAQERERRVVIEQRRLIDKAGARERRFVPRWAAFDRFDPRRTREQAERIVRDRHERLLDRIVRIESSRLRPLVQEAQDRLRPGLPGLFELNARPAPARSCEGPNSKGPSRD